MKINFEEKPCIVYCAAGYGEEIYAKLRSMKREVLCFCDNAKRNQGIKILDRYVYSYQRCRELYPEAVYIIANSRYAKALRIGADLERDGLIRNETYFLSLDLEAAKILPEACGGVFKEARLCRTGSGRDA